MSSQSPESLGTAVLEFAATLNEAIEDSSIPEKFSSIDPVANLRTTVKELKDYIDGQGNAETLSESDRKTLSKFSDETLIDILASCDGLRIDFENQNSSIPYTKGLWRYLKPVLDDFESRWQPVGIILSKLPKGDYGNSETTEDDTTADDMNGDQTTSGSMYSG